MRGRIETLIWQTRIFGFHLATLEVRENAPALHYACRVLLPGYVAASREAQRAALLTQACTRLPIPERDNTPAPKAATAAAFDSIARAVGTYGPRRSTPSSSPTPSSRRDLLCALWLRGVAASSDLPTSRPRTTSAHLRSSLSPYSSVVRHCGKRRERWASSTPGLAGNRHRNLLPDRRKSPGSQATTSNRLRWHGHGKCLQFSSCLRQAASWIAPRRSPVRVRLAPSSKPLRLAHESTRSELLASARPLRPLRTTVPLFRPSPACAIS
jgi:hypothetical protein